MVRTFIILLLLAVFFLSGTLYGMNQNANEQTIEQTSEEVVKVTPTANQPEIIEREMEPVPIVEQDIMAMDNQVHLTQKTASFLETSVQGFYEVVVGILYHVADLFF